MDALLVLLGGPRGVVVDRALTLAFDPVVVSLYRDRLDRYRSVFQQDPRRDEGSDESRPLLVLAGKLSSSGFRVRLSGVQSVIDPVSSALAEITGVGALVVWRVA